MKVHDSILTMFYPFIPSEQVSIVRNALMLAFPLHSSHADVKCTQGVRQSTLFLFIL